MKKSGSPTSNGGDAIGMESSVHNVWVDHATLIASGGEDAGYDGLFDMKADTKYVTLSYSILKNSGRGGLVGSSRGRPAALGGHRGVCDEGSPPRPPRGRARGQWIRARTSPPTFSVRARRSLTTPLGVLRIWMPIPPRIGFRSL